MQRIWTTPGNVFVVDDDAGIREALRNFLTAAGYSVRVLTNGREALDALKADGSPPDLMVLDVLMPEMTGPELIVELRADPRLAHIPIIVLTGTKGYSAAGLRVDAVLMKPFNAVDVQAAIYLARSSMRNRGG